MGIRGRHWKVSAGGIENIRRSKLGINNPMFGRRFSVAHRHKLSEAHGGIKNGFYGNKHADETKAKMSVAKCGKPSPMSGRVHTPEARKVMSLKASKRLGQKSGNWRGGLTSLAMSIRRCLKYRQWRLDVFKRDNYCCQFVGCEKRGGDLHVHHIKSFASILRLYHIRSLIEAIECEALWERTNGITFCVKHHRIIEGNPSQDYSATTE